MPALLCLTLFGIILAGAMHRSMVLGAALGLGAGVLVLLLYERRPRKGGPGTEDGVDGASGPWVEMDHHGCDGSSADGGDGTGD